MNALKFAVSHKNKHTKVLVDPSTKADKKTIWMIANSDYPIIPHEFLDDFDPNAEKNDNLKKIYKICKKPIIVTLGDKGALVYNGKKKIIPAYKVKVLDKLGAGDIFRAGFAWGILNDFSLEKSIICANAVAALQCTKYGNGSAIPEKKKILKIFEKVGLKM